jgi:hypothetical protein
MPLVCIANYLVIFDPLFPLGFAFLFPYLDDWFLLTPFAHNLLQCVQEPVASSLQAILEDPTTPHDT